MNGRVAPPLVVKAADFIEVCEKGKVIRRAKEVEVGDFEVGPDYVYLSISNTKVDGNSRRTNNDSN